MGARSVGTVVVTGAAGFLGRVVVQQLLEGGSPLAPREVRALDRARVVEPRARPIEADVRSLAALREAVRGADAVIHCAALVDWGREPDEALHAVNVVGTDNVIQACRAEGVPAMVHTSTLDVLWTGRPLRGGDESLPHAAQHANGYNRTKAEAERRALAASDARLGVSVIRPCCIFGEGDPFHVEPLLELGRRGRLVRVGDGRARCSFSYVGNVAHGLLVAARSLLEDRRAAGQVYFVTDCAPANFFDFVAPFVEAEGVRMPPASSALPRAPLYAIGAALESAAALARPLVRLTPTLTRFAVDFVCQDFIIESDKIARELGYAPRFTPEEAVLRTIAWHRRRALSA
ncbi:MAG: NAD-dependent epimerase/dehydratase family protein [Sandaracinaceae bacterium]|nr:NAD-dependent epimerase/dehydratase family protein [Sandaracinaceae bacterium]